MRYTPEKHGIENTMLRTGDQIVKNLDLRPGDLVRILDSDQLVTCGFVVETSLTDAPDVDRDLLFTIKVRKSAEINDKS